MNLPARRLRLHDPAVRGFASDNYAGVHPESWRRWPPPTAATRSPTARTSTPARLQRGAWPSTSARASRCSRCSTAPAPTCCRLQSMLPRWGAVVCADDRAHQHGRERRAGAGRRAQAAHRARPPDGKLTPELIDRRGLGLGRRAPGPAAGRVHHPDHRAGHRLHARGDPRDRRPRARAGHEAARGRRPAGQRGRHAGRAAARVHHRRRGGRAVASAAPRTGCCSARRWWCCDPQAADGLIYLRKMNMQLASKMRFISAQLVALLEERPVAAVGAARQRDGGAAARGRGRDRRRAAVHPASRPTRCSRPPTDVADRLRERFRFYDWDRGRRRGALDVRLRHHRGRRRRFRRGAAGGNGPLTGGGVSPGVSKFGGRRRRPGAAYTRECEPHRRPDAGSRRFPDGAVCPAPGAEPPGGEVGRDPGAGASGPFAVALCADVSERPHRRPQGPHLVGPREQPQASEGQALATGRFILLYDPDGSALWDGNFRHRHLHPRPAGAGHGQRRDARLRRLDVARGRAGGPRGALPRRRRDRHAGAVRKLRHPGRTRGHHRHRTAGLLDAGEADINAHLEAWSDMVCTFAGLPPLPEGVTPCPGCGGPDQYTQGRARSRARPAAGESTKSRTRMSSIIDPIECQRHADPGNPSLRGGPGAWSRWTHHATASPS